MSDRLFSHLPAIYRLRDHAQGSPLRALLAVVDDEVQQLEEDIAGLYDNWFIETCDEWVVPYIGDLLGVRPLVPLRHTSFSQRGHVANTVGYRRRKGTAAVLEQLARDLTGWPTRVVELFESVAATQHVNHPRLHAPATADLRNAACLEDIGTPFEQVTHTVDVRHIDNGRGRYNIPHVGLFVFRLQNHLLGGVTARQMDATRARFNPLGLDAPLFNVPATEGSLTDIAERRHVPLALSRRLLRDRLTDYYGTADDPASIRISIDGVVQPAALIDVCDLSDVEGGLWAHGAQPGRISIDPILGRIAFDTAPSGEVTTSCAHGAGGEIGGGPYDRRESLGHAGVSAIDWQAGVTHEPPVGEPRIHATLGAAIAAWNEQPPGTNGVIALLDSRSYAEDLSGAAARIRIPAGSRLLIVAAQWPEEETGDPLRPLARITGRLVPSGVRAHVRGRLEVAGTATAASTAPGTLALNGLLIEGALVVADGDLGTLRVDHCTLAPGLSTVDCGANPRLEIALSRSIVGDLPVRGRTQGLDLADTIVAGAIDADALRADRCTVFGATRAHTLEASESLFVGVLTIARRQVGCVRFSALPFASETPPRYRCQPGTAAEAPLAAVFSSTRYGDPDYAMLAPGCPAAIAQGAEDEGEIGAWNFLQTPTRLRNLRDAVDEYLRFGLEAGIVVASQQP